MLNHEEIKRRRESLRLTMEEAALRAGLPSRQRWYDIESGRRADVTASTLRAVALALACPMESLMLDDPPKQPKRKGRPK